MSKIDPTLAIYRGLKAAGIDFAASVHRGCEGEPIVGQVPMGRLTPGLLDVMDIRRFSPSPAQAEETVAQAWKLAEGQRRPVAVLLDLQFWRGA